MISYLFGEIDGLPFKVPSKIKNQHTYCIEMIEFSILIKILFIDYQIEFQGTMYIVYGFSFRSSLQI